MEGYPIVLVGPARAVVVGAGAVAHRKIEGLLACGAEVLVISPAAAAPVLLLAREGRIRLVARSYAPGDLEGARLVIAATGDPAVNDAVYREAMGRGLLVNVVDDPARCAFHLPAVVRRGPITVAVSTGGASPYLAGLLRRRVARSVGAEYGDLAALYAGWRGWILDNVAADCRPALWEELTSVLLPLLRGGLADEARQAAADMISRAAGKPAPAAWLHAGDAL